MKKRYALGAGLALLAIVMGCSKSKRSESNVASAAVANLTTMSEGFAPASLSYSGTTGYALRYAPQADVCDATGDTSGNRLFSCQPILLRIYVDVAQQYLEMMKAIVESAGKSLGALADGASGTASADGKTIVYSKSSGAKYSFIVKEGDNPVAYVDVNGSVYTLRADFAKMSSATADMPAQFEAVASFTDADHWTVRVTSLDSTCQSTDVRAPRRARILMSKDGNVWKGKAMLYNGVWAYGIAANLGTAPTCSTPDADGTSMTLLTDFVGDGTAAKAKVYMTTRVASSVAAIEASPLNNFCSTYGISAACTSLGVNLTAFANPFCNRSNTITATWNDSCAASSSSVASAEFGASTDWTTPADFASSSTTKIELPTSL